MPSTGVSIIVAAAVFIASLLVFELAIERRRGVAGWTDAVAAVMRFTFSILTCWAVVNGTTGATASPRQPARRHAPDWAQQGVAPGGAALIAGRVRSPRCSLRACPLKRSTRAAAVQRW